MNALYVTVSIPFLLVLAEFNNAHGLTTFGKSQNNNPPPPPPQPTGKLCENHTGCRGVQGTSCVPDPRDPSRMSCLCGDNRAPRNGACSATQKGPKHLCTDSKECVIGAECLPNNNRNGNLHNQESEKVCTCMEGFAEASSFCSGGNIINILPGILTVMITVSRLL